MYSQNADHIRQHVTMLQDKLEEGYIYLYLIDTGQVLWYEFGETETLIEDAVRNKDQTIYIGVHPSKTLKTSRLRAKRDDVSAIVVIPLDFDVADENAHKKTDLPQSKDDVIKFLKDLNLDDKITLYDSGYGIHGYVLLDKSFLITDEQSRERAENLTKGINRYIIAEAIKRYGWNLDAVGDLARVMRLCGSLNHKQSDAPKLVKPIKITDYRFTIEELEALIPPAEQGIQEDSFLAGWSTQVKKNDKKAKFEPIIKGCRFVRDCVEDAETLKEPEWYALISITARCENGEEVSQKASNLYTNYSSAETSKKVKQSLDATTGSVTCKYIKEQFSYPACLTCPLQTTRMKSPIALGYASSFMAGLFSCFVYDIDSKKFYEINSSQEALV